MKAVSIWIILFLCVACVKHKDKSQSSFSIEYQIFNVNNSLSFDGLKKEGFEREEAVDVYNLVKQINDSTTLTYFIDDSSKQILSQRWEIGFGSFDEDVLQDFVSKNNALIISTLCNFEKLDFVDFFVERYYTSRIYFRCRFQRKSTGAVLEVHNWYL